MTDRGKTDIYGESDVPRFTVESAALCAIESAERSLGGDGAKLRKMVVLIWAEGVPVGEPECTTSGHGYDDGLDLVVEVFGHFAGAMKQLGKEVKLVPVEQADGRLN